MLHNHPPEACWCREKHTHGQVASLNFLGRYDQLPDTGPEVPPALTDVGARRRSITTRTPDGEDDRLDAAVREAGGWDAVTDDQLNQIISKQRASSEPSDELTEIAREYEAQENE